ncbi:Gfa-like protein, partial [hydrothermal vent metagenome]
MSETLTGGCQCGAIRFATKLVGRPSICHCRMCQKAFGGLFGPLVTSHDGHWTRGKAKWFESSNVARRAFCPDCGTPLAYETRYGLELAIGAFDDPAKVAPLIQVNLTDKQPFFDGLTSLPVKNDAGD